MKTFKNTIYCLAILAAFIACDNSEVAEEDKSSVIKIDLSKREQVIRNFGASDAWSCQFIGKNWPLAKRNEMADLLFSTGLDEEGNPEGIGLSLWRFNIGAGTAEQGADSDIDDEWRRAESFLNADGSYDWQKQEGQQWFLEAAQSRGVDQFVAFVNSPPVHMTRNGKGYSLPDNTANLKADAYDDFASFMTNVLQHFEEQGTGFDYISPVNEPQWNWDSPGQEGSSYRNEEIYKVVQELDATIEEMGLDTKIELTEAARITDLFQNESLPDRNYQLYEFFEEGSELYLGDLSHVAQKVAAHSYFTTYPESDLKNYRRQLNESINQVNPNLEFWMSEYCLLEDNPQVKGGGRDLSMNPAIYMAKVIHHDLTYANASAWHWWIAISPYDYKDGLIYIDHNKSDGEIYESKMLWTLGNYSRFIRPGMVRIAIDESEESGILKSAFTDEDNLVVVLVNTNYEDQSVQVETSGFTTFKKYVTGNASDLNLTFTGSVKADTSVDLPSRSVITLVAEKD